MTPSDNPTPPGEPADSAADKAADKVADKPSQRSSERKARETVDEEEEDRVPLRGLGSISAPVDLTRTVPELIRRRSQGRFFGRKRLVDRLPLEWMSLVMLLLLAAIYAVLKLFSTN